MIKSTEAQNAACNAVTRLVDLGSTNPSGRLDIYDALSTTLVQLPLALPAFYDAIDGTALAYTIPNALATNSGSASTFGILNRDASTVWTGTVSNFLGDGDLKINSVYIAADSTVTITDMVYIVPPQFLYIGEQGVTGLSGSGGGGTGIGSPGATGIQGLTGPYGGPQGVTGIQGLGLTGIQGIQGGTGLGTNGQTGLQGVTGFIGNTGIQGPLGQGITGFQGPQGDPGLGATGIQGNTGLQGLGATGLAGVGVTGIQGLRGVTGLQGLGATGLLGGSGQTGIQGNTGLQGLGVTGLAGVGTTGIQGTVGTQGVTGLRGFTGLIGLGTTGIQGNTGVGPQGITGLRGTSGVQGATGVGSGGVGAASYGMAVSRYAMTTNAGEEVWCVSASTVFSSLTWTRSGTALTINNTAHGHLLGNRVIIRNTNVDYQVAVIASIPTSDSFVVVTSNGGGTSGSAAAYSLGFTFAHTGSPITGGVLTAPSGIGVSCQLLSLRLGTGQRASSTFDLTVPASALNGAGSNTVLGDCFVPEVTVRQSSDTLVVVGATINVNTAGAGYSVFRFGALGVSGTTVLILLHF